MLDIKLDWILLFLIQLVIVATLFMWYYGDKSRYQLYIKEQKKYVFHCIKCGQLYSKTEDSEEDGCPGCGQKNIRLRF